jgi:hypothetical protein
MACRGSTADPGMFDPQDLLQQAFNQSYDH